MSGYTERATIPTPYGGEIMIPEGPAEAERFASGRQRAAALLREEAASLRAEADRMEREARRDLNIAQWLRETEW